MWQVDVGLSSTLISGLQTNTFTRCIRSDILQLSNMWSESNPYLSILLFTNIMYEFQISSFGRAIWVAYRDATRTLTQLSPMMRPKEGVWNAHVIFTFLNLKKNNKDLVMKLMTRGMRLSVMQSYCHHQLWLIILGTKYKSWGWISWSISRRSGTWDFFQQKLRFR